jgi:hypothetical protein
VAVKGGPWPIELNASPPLNWPPALVADDIGWLGGQKNNFLSPRLHRLQMTLCSALGVATAVEIKLALLRIFVLSPQQKLRHPHSAVTV